MSKARKDSPTCDTFCVNEKKVAAVKKVMLPDETIGRIAATFKALGDPTRAKIISALLKEELCVCDLSSVVGISQSAVSHQLRVLRNMALVKYPEYTPIVEAWRAAEDLKRQVGIETAMVAVNYLLLKDSGNNAFFRKRRRQQDKYLSEIRQEPVQQAHALRSASGPRAERPGDLAATEPGNVREQLKKDI